MMSAIQVTPNHQPLQPIQDEKDTPSTVEPTEEGSPEVFEKKEQKISTHYKSMCYVNTVKAEKRDKIGLKVKKSDEWNVIYVSDIKPDSKFSDSKLEVGDVILTINGKQCPKTVKEITKEIMSCVGTLALMCAKLSPAISLIDTTPAVSPASSKEEKPVNDYETVGPELVDDDDHPHNINVDENGIEIEAPQIQKSNSSTQLDKSRAAANRRSSEPMALPSQSGHGTPPPERAVSTSSARESSPVRVVHIDPTGTLNVTPRCSPQPSKEFVDVFPKAASISSSGRKQQSQQDRDRKAKRDAKRTARMAQMPEMRPGAFAIKSGGVRASTANNGKGASRSQSPRGYSSGSQDSEAKRRAMTAASRGLSPHRQNVPSGAQPIVPGAGLSSSAPVARLAAASASYDRTSAPVINQVYSPRSPRPPRNPRHSSPPANMGVGIGVPVPSSPRATSDSIQSSVSTSSINEEESYQQTESDGCSY